MNDEEWNTDPDRPGTRWRVPVSLPPMVAAAMQQTQPTPNPAAV